MKSSLLFLILSLPLTAFAHKVISISDGDTLTLLVDNRPLKVRLANIDAPEKSQAYGERSRKSLAALCWGKNARYKVQDIDRYGRTVAEVTCSGAHANRAQVARGMAWTYSKYNKDPKLPGLQEYAKKMRRGLWVDRDPVPPWEFRRAKRKN